MPVAQSLCALVLFMSGLTSQGVTRSAHASKSAQSISVAESEGSLERDYQSTLDVLMPLGTDASIPDELVKQNAKLRIAITVNTVGAFFNASYNGMPLTTDRGRIAGGTGPAQLFILLHELGHITRALQPDRNSQKSVNRNDKMLEKRCKETINAFGR